MKPLKFYIDKLKKQGLMYPIYEVRRRFPLHVVRDLTITDVLVERNNMKLLWRQYRQLIENDAVAESHREGSLPDGKTAIWVYWDQGIDAAPEMVRLCYQQLQETVSRYHSNAYELVALSAENLKDFVCLPDFIEKKYAHGKITRTHYSDLLRLELLVQYGGIWIDSTVLVTGALPDYLTDEPMFFFRNSPTMACSANFSSWVLKADIHHPSILILQKAREVLFAYWREHDHLLDYLLLHLIVQLIVDKNATCKQHAEQVPWICNSASRVLGLSMNKPYYPTTFKYLTAATPIHKCTYKNISTSSDAYTFYNYMIEKYSAAPTK